MADITVTISAVDKTSPVLLKISGAAKKTGSDLEAAGAKGKKGLEDIEKGGAKADTQLRTFERTSLAVGAAMGAFALGLVKVSAAAAQQERQIAAIGRLYGEAGDEVLQFAETIQDATRFSNDAARQSAVVLNTLMANYGLAQSQIETLMSRSADLAALHGKSLEEVSQMVSNALRGEGEYIEQIGVTMNQTFIAAEAAARGLGNFITEMCAAEQAAFRYTVFLEQTAAAQGYAMESAEGARGAIGLLINEVQDMGQALGGALGPVGDVAARFNEYALWLPLIASQTARVSAIMINAARSGQLFANSMRLISFGISPMGIIVGALSVGLVALAGSFLKNRQQAQQTAAAFEMVANSAENLEERILQMFTSGDYAVAKWSQNMQTRVEGAINDALQIRVDDEVYDTWWEDIVNRGLVNADNPDPALIDELYSRFEMEPETADRIYQSLGKIFDLANNPYIDTAAFQAEFGQLWAEIERGITDKTLDTDTIDEMLADFYEKWATTIRKTEELFSDMEFDFRMDDLIAGGQSGLADQLTQLESFFDNAINAQQNYVDATLAQAQATGDYSLIPDPQRYEEFSQVQLEQLAAIQKRFDEILSSGDYDNPAILQAIDDINRAFLAGKIDADIYLASLYNLSTGTNKFAIDTEEATYKVQELAGAMRILSAEAREGAESFKEAFFDNMEDFIGTYLDAFEMSDPLSLLNMSSLRNEFTGLAGDIGRAASQLETVFRVIVSNTDAFKQQAQGVHDWIDSLTEAEEGVRRIDTLLQGGYIDEATYQGAIDAHEAISAAQIEIANNVDAIQTMQAPFIAQFVQNQATILESLRGQDAAQQRVTLGWMDSTTAAQAYTLMQQAVAVGNGELGETGEAAFKAMIEGAVAVNPFLFDMLETIGLISGTPLDFEVNFDGVTEGMTEIEMLTLRIEDLIRALGGDLTPIDLEVNGLDKVEDANRSVEELLSNSLRDIAINIAAKFDEGSGPIADILAGRAREMAPLLIPVEYDYANMPDPSMDSKRLLDPIKVPVEFDYEDLPDPSAGQALTIPVELDLMGTVDDVIPEDTTVTITFEPDTSELYSMIEVISGGDISGPKFTFTYDSTDVTTAATTLSGANYSGPTFDFVPNDDDVASTASTVARANWFGPTFLFQANTSSLQAAINQYAGRTLATAYIDVQVRQTGSINVPGQLPGQRNFAHGGVLFHGAEVGPEVLHFAGGGVSTIREPGLYMAPPNTYVSPANANRGSDGGNTYVYSQNAPVYGVDDLHEEFRKFAMAMANENTRHRLAAGVS